MRRRAFPWRRSKPTSTAGSIPVRSRPSIRRRTKAAMMLFTSGSTGRPKGVRLSHASHLWVVRTRMADDDLAGERMLIAAPLYHMNALAKALLALASGATVLLLPQFQARAYIAAIDRRRATWATAVPPMIAMMLREKAALAEADLSSVGVVRMGSAPVNDALAAQTCALLPNARIINAYGTTEGGPVVFSDPDGSAPTGSVGRPHPGVEVRLVGPDAPDLGVLQMKSPAIMLGYHERPDVRSPILADGWYVSGDVFRRDASGSYSSSAAPTTCSSPAARTSFPARSRHAREPSGGRAGVRRAGGRRGQGREAGRVRGAEERPTLQRTTCEPFALAHGPAYQHPRRVCFLDEMPLAGHEQGRPRGAEGPRRSRAEGVVRMRLSSFEDRTRTTASSCPAERASFRATSRNPSSRRFRLMSVGGVMGPWYKPGATAEVG